jgi:hypothetical protein
MRCAVKAKSPSDERSAGNRHATFCGSRGRFVAPGDPVGGSVLSDRASSTRRQHDKNFSFQLQPLVLVARMRQLLTFAGGWRAAPRPASQWARLTHDTRGPEHGPNSTESLENAPATMQLNGP